MSPGAGSPAATGPRVPRALVAVAALAAAAFAAVTAGVVELPDLEAALTDLSDTLGTWTYALVAALAFLETGAFVGLIAPGETAIVLGGVVAAHGDVDLAVMLPVAWLSAALGDLVSFWLGRRLGRRFLIERGPRLGVTASRLRRVEGFFADHGSKAILIGRFVGIVRAVAPLPGRRLRDAPARVPAVEPARHGGLGLHLHADRLRLQRVLQRRRRRTDPRSARAGADRDGGAPLARASARGSSGGDGRVMLRPGGAARLVNIELRAGA